MTSFGLRIPPDFDAWRVLEAFRAECRDYVRREVSLAVRRECDDFGLRHSEDAWRKLTDLYKMNVRGYDFSFYVSIWHYNGGVYLLPTIGSAYTASGVGYGELGKSISALVRYPNPWDDSDRARRERTLWGMFGEESKSGIFRAGLTPFLTMTIVSLENWQTFCPNFDAESVQHVSIVQEAEWPEVETFRGRKTL